MKKLFTMFVILAVATMAIGQDQNGGGGDNPVNPPAQNGIDNLHEAPPATTSDTAKQEDPATTDQSRSDQGTTIVNIANNYFEAKGDYIRACNCGDKVRAHRARTRMVNYQTLIDEFKKSQAARDNAQDKRLDAHSSLAWKHESQLNGKNGLESRVKTLQNGQAGHEKRLKAMETEGDNFALLNLPARLNYHTWWLLALTLIVLIGFIRRYWIR